MIKLNKFSISLIFCGLISLSSFASNSSKEVSKSIKSALKATLSINKNEIKFGETVELNLKLENPTDKDIVLFLKPKWFTNLNKNGIEDGSFIKVTNKKNEEIIQNKVSLGGKQPALITDKFFGISKNSKTGSSFIYPVAQGFPLAQISARLLGA